VAGSPHYLAPEQMRGETIDRRCDVYALGVVMYELLTHRKAFDGKSLTEIVHAVEHTKPATPHELRPEVPLALSDITMRAIAHDPAQRYRSARQMSQALKQWVDAEAELAGDEGAQGRSGKRRLVAGALVVGAAIGAVAGWQLLGLSDTEPSHTAEAAAPPATAPAPAPIRSSVPIIVATAVSAGDDGTSAASNAANEVPTTPPSVAAPPAPRAHVVERPAVREPRVARETNARSSAAAAATGVVQLAVAPWGQIEVDGKGAGVTPPLAQLTLSVGEHVITVRNADFAPHTITVRVSADQPAVVRHRFGS
jgi:serine/threonine-protein kinase